MESFPRLFSAGRRGYGFVMPLRQLDQRQRDSYLTRWHEVQAQFVDDPEAAVARADALLEQALRDCGYPESAVDDYRTGGDDLRQSFQLYRELFDELIRAQRA